MKRTPFIAGNWKMNMNAVSGVDLARRITSARIDFSDLDVVIAPSFTDIYPVSEILKEAGGKVKTAAQNVYFEDSGAFTGEVSCDMVKNAGASWVIIGHSERRSLFGETDEEINRKTLKVLSAGLGVILCVGETLWEREAGAAEETVMAQTGKGLSGVEEFKNIVVAYEPVWAIGTGKTASVSEAGAMHKSVRNYVSKVRSDRVADSLRIVYGGSVKPENASELLRHEDIDGALVGGASLKADDFIKIINFDK